MGQRDYSIDVLKCLAALLITYSHLEPLFGKYAILATGGSFGDCLFFFCSGYTLLLSQRKESFLIGTSDVSIEFIQRYLHGR